MASYDQDDQDDQDINRIKKKNLKKVRPSSYRTRHPNLLKPRYESRRVSDYCKGRAQTRLLTRFDTFSDLSRPDRAQQVQEKSCVESCLLHIARFLFLLSYVSTFYPGSRIIAVSCIVIKYCNAYEGTNRTECHWVHGSWSLSFHGVIASEVTSVLCTVLLYCTSVRVNIFLCVKCEIPVQHNTRCSTRCSTVAPHVSPKLFRNRW